MATEFPGVLDPMDELEDYMDEEEQNAPKRVSVCPYCQVSYVQRQETSPAITEALQMMGRALPHYYPAYCLQPACTALDDLVQEAHTRDWRRQATPDQLVQRITRKAQIFARLLKVGLPDALLEERRVAVREALEDLLIRTGANRGQTSERLPDDHEYDAPEPGTQALGVSENKP